ncbi:MAG: CorA family divalent cation transporter [Patescibacteria group bacterium]|nr:CorA family divalent cation transporter [Patescibacteria group bacterium]
MRSRYEHNGLVWIDLESPSREEVQDIINEFGIQPLVAEELLLPTTKPRVEITPDYMYLVLHFPALRHSHKTKEQEIDFIIGQRYLITTRYDTIDPIHKFSKIFEVNSILDKSNVGEHAGYLFFYMLKKLYKAVEHEVEYVRHDLTIVEDHIFTGHEVDMVAAISRSARDLLNLRQTIEPHRETLRELEAAGPRFFGHDFHPYLKALSNEYYRVHNHISRHTESLHELRETNNSLLSTKQNEAMRILTIMAFVTFPLSLIASIFGMNTSWLPIVGMTNDFWYVTAIMAAAALAMFIFFKRKKWL